MDRSIKAVNGTVILLFLALCPYTIRGETFSPTSETMAITTGIAVTSLLLYTVIKHTKQLRMLLAYGNAEVSLFKARNQFEKSIKSCLADRKQTSLLETKRHIECWQKMKTLEKEVKERKLLLYSQIFKATH
jgi:hypothetical protein